MTIVNYIVGCTNNTYAAPSINDSLAVHIRIIAGANGNITTGNSSSTICTTATNINSRTFRIGQCCISCIQFSTRANINISNSVNIIVIIDFGSLNYCTCTNVLIVLRFYVAISINNNNILFCIDSNSIVFCVSSISPDYDII